MRWSRKRIGIALCGGLCAALCGFLAWSIVPTLAAKPDLRPTRVLARDGSLLYEVRASDAETMAPVPLTAMPPKLIQAVLAAEDKRFYAHHGIDWAALLRSAWDDLRAGQVVSGGSTLEEQLIKNRYFPGARRTPLQKTRELAAARWWSLTHEKDETLALYLNTVYLGDQAFGMPTAAREYFHKDVGDLSLPEAAMLAGVIGAPSRFEPVSHRTAALARQKFVLERMRDDGGISAEEAAEAEASEVTVFAPRHELRAPHFVFRALASLEAAIPDIRTGGYVVTTTLDPSLQAVAERSVTDKLLALASSHVTDAAVVMLRPRTGEVLAYVGSADYWDEPSAGAVDMAAAPRQPGSALKPFMYQQALMRETVTPATVIADLPARFEAGQDGGLYVPRNYDLRYHGPVSVRDALGSSLNIPAVKTLAQLGLPDFFGQLKRFGLTFDRPPSYYGLGIVLGGGEVTLTEATHAYADLANGNADAPVTFVQSVVDREGKTVFAASVSAPTPVFETKDEARGRQATYLLTDILSDQGARFASFGEESLLHVPGVAAKTGTTRDYRDNWAFGYTPDFALGVWAGNADDSPMYGVSGISGSVPIWHDIVMAETRFAKPSAPSAPEGIVTRDVCVTSGLLATPDCPKTRLEKFIAGTEPTAPDTWYQRLHVDPTTDRLATARCPGAVERIFLVPPPEYRAWAESAAIEAPPALDCDGRVTAFAGDDAPVILSPVDGDVFSIDPHVDPAAQLVPFVAGSACPRGCEWSIDGHAIHADASTYLWPPQPGDHVLDLAGAIRQVRFSVR